MNEFKKYIIKKINGKTNTIVWTSRMDRDRWNLPGFILFFEKYTRVRGHVFCLEIMGNGIATLCLATYNFWRPSSPEKNDVHYFWNSDPIYTIFHLKII
jgi:hypothetical protein